MLACLLILMTPPAWPMEELTLTNGARLCGLVLSESPEGVRFRAVRRPEARPTVTFTSFFPPVEVKAIRRLAESERKILTAKLVELDTAGGRADQLTLLPEKLPWTDAAQRYDSERFTLICTTKDEIARRAAVRLEQIFVAYERYLPPRTEQPRPITIYLMKDDADYTFATRAVLKAPADFKLFPPLAFFDATSNTVVCGSELRQLGADLAAARLHHLQQLAEVTRYEKDVAELYKSAPKAERDRHLTLAAEERKKVMAADRRNDARFDDATSQLFARLYHEAFHAYVCGYVYRELSLAGVKAGEGTGSLPRWLNEGLAQIFETSILDGYELRVGHADTKRLAQLKTMKLLPLSELIANGFTDIHRPQPADTAAAYLTSWAVAHHLMFEKRLVGTKAMDDYVRDLNLGTPPRKAFEKLTGRDIAGYERELKDYVAKLRP